MSGVLTERPNQILGTEIREDMGINPGIIRLVSALRGLGAPTIGSCDGNHKDCQEGYPFVEILGTMPKQGRERLVSLLREFNKDSSTKWRASKMKVGFRIVPKRSSRLIRKKETVRKSAEELGTFLSGKTEKSDTERCEDDLEIIDPALKKCMDSMYKVPARFLDKLWLMVGSVGTALTAMPSQLVGSIPSENYFFPAAIFSAVALGLMKDEIIKKETTRRANKLLGKVEKHINANTMKTYAALATLLEVNRHLESINARGTYNVPIISLSKLILQKLDYELDRGTVRVIDAGQQFSSLMGILSLREQDAMLGEIASVRKKCFGADTPS